MVRGSKVTVWVLTTSSMVAFRHMCVAHCLALLTYDRSPLYCHSTRTLDVTFLTRVSSLQATPTSLLPYFSSTLLSFSSPPSPPSLLPSSTLGLPSSPPPLLPPSPSQWTVEAAIYKWTLKISPQTMRQCWGHLVLLPATAVQEWLLGTLWHVTQPCSTRLSLLVDRKAGRNLMDNLQWAWIWCKCQMTKGFQWRRLMCCKEGQLGEKQDLLEGTQGLLLNIHLWILSGN